MCDTAWLGASERDERRAFAMGLVHRSSNPLRETARVMVVPSTGIFPAALPSA